MYHVMSSNCDHGSEVFQTFKIEDKIQELEKMLVIKQMNLQDKSVIIAVPSYDESMRSIKKDDEVLYDVQLKDAHALAEYVMVTMDTDLVSIVTDIEQLSALIGKVASPHECIIYLHEFMNIEKSDMLEILTEYNANLTHIELY